MVLKSFILSVYYCYKSIKSSIESILSRYGLPASCEEWRDRKVSPNLLCDAYDGQVWKDFIKNEFLREPYNYALALNIDWFQPFTHTIQCWCDLSCDYESTKEHLI